MGAFLSRPSKIKGTSVGINWTFAPVIDIDRNFRNPITNVRTYGFDPERTLRMARAYQKGAAEEGLSRHP